MKTKETKTKLQEEIEKGCGFQDTYSKGSLCRKGNLCHDCKEHLEIYTQAKQGLRQEMYNLDWFKIMKEAIDFRKTSWSERPIVEWRNASDEVCMAVIREMEKKKLVEPIFKQQDKKKKLEELGKSKEELDYEKDCEEGKI